MADGMQWGYVCMKKLVGGFGKRNYVNLKTGDSHILGGITDGWLNNKWQATNTCGLCHYFVVSLMRRKNPAKFHINETMIGMKSIYDIHKNC